MTNNCIQCSSKATVWTGHVLKGKQMITAGWCKDHLHQSENMNLMKGAGCFGEHKSEYGLRPEFENSIEQIEK